MCRRRRFSDFLICGAHEIFVWKLWPGPAQTLWGRESASSLFLARSLFPAGRQDPAPAVGGVFVKKGLGWEKRGFKNPNPFVCSNGESHRHFLVALKIFGCTLAKTRTRNVELQNVEKIKNNPSRFSRKFSLEFVGQNIEVPNIFREPNERPSFAWC